MDGKFLNAGFSAEVLFQGGDPGFHGLSQRVLLP